MKRLLVIVLLLGCLGSFGACMWMGQEDKDFFGRGWVNPKELDRAPAPTMPVRPGASDANAVPAPAARTPVSAPDDGEWSTPAPH